MPGFNIEARSHIGPFMRSIFSIAVLFFSALAPNARAQAEATFPLSEDTAEEGSKDASSEEQRSSDDPAIPSETPAPAPQPQGPPPQVDDPNPYGVPPAPPPPLPGNPYGTVPHRPPTPPPNPYVGEPRRAATAASPQVVEETNWSVGGGLVGETSSSALSAGYGPITQSRLRPSLLFERRLSRALHLLLQSSVVYQKSRLEGPNAVDTSIEESSYEEFNLRFEGGLRWVANPGGPVELGMSHVISLANYQSISEGRPNIYYLYLPNLGDAEIDEWTI